MASRGLPRMFNRSRFHRAVSMSHFKNVTAVPPDAAFALVAAYAKDSFPHKVDLCPGFYRDEQARPWILTSVAEAKELLHADPSINHEHLPLSGHPDLVRSARELVFGPCAQDAARIASIQTVSGTGANYLAARFLSETLAPKRVWISDPSWINHPEIWQNVNPAIDRRTYPYFAKETLSLDFQAMVDALSESAGRGDVVILHGCAHNPTGIDLSKDQWKMVADICEQKVLFPLFDLAYQGFATGDLAEDAWAIRHFYSRKRLEFGVAQSFSKNFGLYSERVGALHLVTDSPENAAKAAGKLARMQRAEITTPPAYGARIVSKILGDESLQRQWQHDLNRMSARMKQMRQRLHDELQKRQTPGSWAHILSEVLELKEKYHIYLLPSGRISVTGLTEHNVEYVAEAFDKVIKSSKT